MGIGAFIGTILGIILALLCCCCIILFIFIIKKKGGKEEGGEEFENLEVLQKENQQLYKEKENIEVLQTTNEPPQPLPPSDKAQLNTIRQQAGGENNPPSGPTDRTDRNLIQQIRAQNPQSEE